MSYDNPKRITVSRNVDYQNDPNFTEIALPAPFNGGKVVNVIVTEIETSPDSNTPQGDIVVQSADNTVVHYTSGAVIGTYMNSGEPSYSFEDTGDGVDFLSGTEKVNVYVGKTFGGAHFIAKVHIVIDLF